ncbi:hypothetical protein HY479_01555 [Candidatus Uhrbacteria bacterium]|nr:hypothetical protein [Candidatus Uhrbacteria bacterium]
MKTALSVLIFLGAIPIAAYAIYLGAAWVGPKANQGLDTAIEKTEDPSWFSKFMKEIGG